MPVPMSDTDSEFYENSENEHEETEQDPPGTLYDMQGKKIHVRDKKQTKSNKKPLEFYQSRLQNNWRLKY